MWIWTDYAYSGGSTQSGIWVAFLRDGDTGEETVAVYDYSGSSVVTYQTDDPADVTASLNTQTGTYYQGVGVGKITGSFSATVTESGTTDTAMVSVTNLDAVLYDYAAYTNSTP